MTDTSNLTQLISALRAETESASISPENLGYILQSIVDFLPNLDDSGMVGDIAAAKANAATALTKAAEALTSANNATAVAVGAQNVANAANATAEQSKTAAQAATAAVESLTALVQALQTASGEDKFVVKVDYNESDKQVYESTTNTTRTAHLYAISVAPNQDGDYYVNGVKIWGEDGAIINLSLYKIERMYPGSTNLQLKLTKVDELGRSVVEDSVANFVLKDIYIPQGHAIVASCNERKISDGTYTDSLYSFYDYNTNIDSVKLNDVADGGFTYQTGGFVGRYAISYVDAKDATARSIKMSSQLKKIVDGDFNDDIINENSSNPVQNKVLYNELNIVEKTIIPPMHIDYLNGDKNQVDGYIASAISIETKETEDYTVHEIDVRASTGVEVKLAVYSFRRLSEDPSQAGLYNRGYFTCKEVLGVVTSVDTHAVFKNLNYHVKVGEDIIIASTGVKAIAFVRNVDNGLKPLYIYNDFAINATNVGQECGSLYYYKFADTQVQGSYLIKYETGYEKEVTTVTNVKDSVKKLLASGEGGIGFLAGKKWAAVGDSVTHGIDETFGEDGYYHTYVYYIAKRNGLLGTTNLHWDGISGSTMAMAATKENVAFANDRYKDVPLDSDYITIWFGINDETMIHMGNETLGTIDSEDRTTFYGAYNFVLRYLITNAPKAKIGLVVSHRCGDLKEAIRRLAKKYGLSVFDLSEDERIPFWHPSESKNNELVDEEIKAFRTERWWYESANVVHPLQEGYEYISYPFENWMRSL